MMAAGAVRHMSGPTWLRASLVLFPLVAALISGGIGLFNLGRDWVMPDRATEGDSDPRHRGLLRDALLNFGSKAWSLCFVLVSFAAAQIIQLAGLSPGLRLPLALTPLVPLVMYLRSIDRDTAGIDELALQVRREAYGFDFCAMIGIFVCVHLLEKAGAIPGFRWNSALLVVVMLGLLTVGAVLSSRRFR